MIVTKVPLRISFAGGGTDLPSYYLDRGIGEVINFSINKYIYITSSEYYDKTKTNFKYSEVETVDNCKNFKNPIVREVLERFSMGHGYQFASLSSVPGGTGLGSSSAFCVGLVKNVAKRLGQELSQYEAAELACHIELDILKEPIGKQDQFGCAIGGMKHLTFKDDRVIIEGLQLQTTIEKDLTSRMVIIRVGGVRSASQILSNIQKNKKINLDKLDQIRKLVPGTKKALISGDIQFLGEQLHENWILKKSLEQGISDNDIDHIYDTMVPDKAYGGKLLGAGGSGYLLFILKEPLTETELPDGVAYTDVKIDKTGVTSIKI